LYFSTSKQGHFGTRWVHKRGPLHKNFYLLPCSTCLFSIICYPLYWWIMYLFALDQNSLSCSLYPAFYISDEDALVDWCCRKYGFDVCSWADIWCWWEENATSSGLSTVKSTAEVVGLKQVLSSILRASYGAEWNRKIILHSCFAGNIQLNIGI
jgi:hypothetical protein